MKTHMNVRMAALAAFSALMVTMASSAAPALAQTPASSRTDARWTPYLGCWHLVVENVRNQGIEAMIRSAVQNATTPPMTVCVQPAATSSGVTMTTFADKNKVLEQAIVADGAGRAVTESGCTGTQTSDWSRDGLRLFTRVEMACSNRPKQTISGLTLFANGPAWVDIQAMESDGDQQVRIRRYVRTLDQPAGLAALPADLTAQATMASQSSSVRRLSLEDVTEASAKVASQAVEAAIVESESRFNLNSHALLQLADAGVSPNVIDLMVAQSFPSHFRVERPADALLGPIVTSLPPSVGMPGMPGSIYPYPGTYGAYDPYSYYGLYYSPFAYPYYWGNSYYNSPRYFITNGGGNVIVNGTGGGTAAPASSGRGQVVNGLGYTRVHTGSEAEGTAVADPNSHPVTNTPRTVRTTGDASASSPSTSTPSTSSSSGSSDSSGGGVSNQGYSNGGGDSGRTAQPR